MSYRTVNNRVFGQPQGKASLKQDFTAIQVEDPHGQDVPGSPQQVTVSRRQVQRSPQQNGTGRKIDDLVARQDQLLSHQMQVSARQNEIADHLKNQNDALNQALLKQILNNKDNMMANLAHQQAAEWDDHTRELLQQHVKYMVAIIQRLNTDIESILAELHGRDIAVIGTNKAVNKLEVHHVTMLQDLRGRIARCDGAISKHTKDIVLLMEEIRRLEQALQLTREKLSGDIHRLEAEVISMTGELERQHTAQRSELTHLRSDALHRINMLEDKQRANMAEFRDALDGNQSNTDHYLERMEAKFKAMIDKATSSWGDLMGQVDRQIEQYMMSILSRLNKLEEQMALDKNRVKDIQHNIENQVLATIQESLSYNDAELARAKLEFRNGFTELQESLSNMKHVVEGRRKLMGNQMNREIGQVKKALYMEQPNYQQEGKTVIFRNVDKSNEW
ncbi:protein FAM81A-like [Mercenaria mercenaria]|uniref:protein FAM81A-like n=1 Tax=Mercenaria mercenaria TaxID=6596 RepID=UPI001E1D94DA|nr:protein FAM81A-like [Mercenaria mercenaria]